MRNADVDHFPLCKHLPMFTEGDTVFLVQVSKKGSSKGKKFSYRSETNIWKHR